MYNICCICVYHFLMYLQNIMSDIYIQNCLERDTILHFHVTYHIYTFLCESMEIFRSSSLSTSHRRLRRHFQKNILSYNIVCCIIDVCIIKNNYAMIFLYTSITLDFYIGILSRENCEFKLEFSFSRFSFFCCLYTVYTIYALHIEIYMYIYDDIQAWNKIMFYLRLEWHLLLYKGNLSRIHHLIYFRPKLDLLSV